MWTSIRWLRMFFVLILIAWAIALAANGNAGSHKPPKRPNLVIENPTPHTVDNNAESNEHHQATQQGAASVKNDTIALAPQQTPTAPQQQHQEPSYEEIWGLGIVKLTAIIAGASMLLALIYLLIYGVMKRTMYLTDRPHLVVENLRIDDWPAGKLFIRADVSNHGKGPGWMTSIRIRSQLGPLNDRDLITAGPPNYGKIRSPFGGVVVPQQKRTIQISDDPNERFLTVDESLRREITLGGMYLFIHGFVEYRDVHRRWIFLPNIYRSCFGYRYVHDHKPGEIQFSLVTNDAYWHYT